MFMVINLICLFVLVFCPPLCKDSFVFEMEVESVVESMNDQFFVDELMS